MRGLATIVCFTALGCGETTVKEPLEGTFATAVIVRGGDEVTGLEAISADHKGLVWGREAWHVSANTVERKLDLLFKAPGGEYVSCHVGVTSEAVWSAEQSAWTVQHGGTAITEVEPLEGGLIAPVTCSVTLAAGAWSLEPPTDRRYAARLVGPTGTLHKLIIADDRADFASVVAGVSK